MVFHFKKVSFLSLSSSTFISKPNLENSLTMGLLCGRPLEGPWAPPSEVVHHLCQPPGSPECRRGLRHPSSFQHPLAMISVMDPLLVHFPRQKPLFVPSPNINSQHSKPFLLKKKEKENQKMVCLHLAGSYSFF